MLEELEILHKWDLGEVWVEFYYTLKEDGKPMRVHETGGYTTKYPILEVKVVEKETGDIYYDKDIITVIAKDISDEEVIHALAVLFENNLPHKTKGTKKEQHLARYMSIANKNVPLTDSVKVNLPMHEIINALRAISQRYDTQDEEKEGGFLWKLSRIVHRCLN